MDVAMWEERGLDIIVGDDRCARRAIVQEGDLASDIAGPHPDMFQHDAVDDDSRGARFEQDERLSYLSLLDQRLAAGVTADRTAR